MLSTIDPDTPVLIGSMALEQRDRDYRSTHDAVGLMIDAARAALPSELADQILPRIDWIGVPKGTWTYRDPAGLVAQALGAGRAHTVLSKVGVLQQTLISEACRRVQAGESEFTMISAGEARYREMMASAAADRAPAIPEPDGAQPDETLRPTVEMSLPAEREAGLRGAVGFYALLESALRAQRGETVEENRNGLGEMYSRFTEIAHANPHATRREVLTPPYLRDASEGNPMLAFPYTKLMVTTWTVDQACALIFATAATAEAYGVPRERWLFPLVSVESNHSVPVTARANLVQPSAMQAMARAASAAADVKVSEIELIDLYSCFPVAVKMAAEGLGIDESRQLTITGGMAFAGGPYNNYVLQTTCRAAELLRADQGKYALVSCVSGLYTKQGFTVWGRDEPSRPFSVVDVTDEVDRLESTLPVADAPEGRGEITACTVLFDADGAERAVAVIALSGGERTVAKSFDPVVVEQVMTVECVGRGVVVSAGSFDFGDG